MRGPANALTRRDVVVSDRMIRLLRANHRQDLFRRVLRLAVLFCVVQFGYFAVSAATAFKNGRMGLPVSLSVIGLVVDELNQINVARLSPTGNESVFERIPGTNEFAAPTAWVSGIRIRGPAHLLARIQALSVRVGPRHSTLDGGALRTTSRPDESVASIDVHLGADARACASAIHVRPIDALANWPGDGAVVNAVLWTREFFCTLVCGIAVGLLRIGRGWVSTRGDLVRTGALALLVAHALVLVLPAMVSRLTFPLSLEHLEGVQAANTWTWIHGGNLYSTPTAEGSGNIYTPAYYVLCRFWTALVGFGLPSLRALTWLLTAFSAVAAAQLLKTQGLSGWWAILWLPVYLLYFPTLGWMDNANKDALHVALAQWGMVSLSFAMAPSASTWRWWAIGAGIAWSVAFMTKQSHLAVVVLVLCAMLVWARRLFWYLAGAFAVSTLALTAWAYRTWGAEFWDWIYVVPKGHALVARSAFEGALQLLLVGAGFFGLAVAGAILTWRRVPNEDSAARARIGMLAVYAFGCIVVGFMSIAKVRGGEYALVPGIAACAVFVVLGIRCLPAQYCPLLLLLFLPAVTSPRPLISAEARRNAEQLIDLVRRTSGSVWVPFHPEVALAAGKHPNVPEFCVGEWTTAGRAYPKPILQALDERRFSMVITDFNLPGFYPLDYNEEPYRTLRRRYSVSDVIPLSQAYVVQDGWTNIPRLVWKRDTPKPTDSDAR